MRVPAAVSVLALLAACSDSGLKKVNSSPTASITSHADGDTVREGYLTTLRGVVGDSNHAIDTLSVTWLIDGQVVCPTAAPDTTGVVGCELDIETGAGVVVLEVSDPEGASANARVTLDVQPTDAPSAVLDSPETGGRYYSDQPIPLLGRVGDTEDAVADLTVTFETDSDGVLDLDLEVLPDGGVASRWLLAEGRHTVRLRVVDSSGKEGVDSAAIEVGPANSEPTCGFTTPDDGAAGEPGDTVTFEALVDDVDIPADQLSVVWSSDRDGELDTSTPDSDGRVRLVWSDLSLGTHLVRATVSDEVGATCTTSRTYTVGQAPSVAITEPTDGDIVNEGEELRFAATVADGEDDPTDLVLEWSSDVDGTLDAQGADSAGIAAFFTDDLSAGAHRVSLTATDTDGLSTVTSVDLTVNALPNAPVVSLAPDPPVTTDDLTATASGSVDPDGSGTVTYGFTWYDDGVLSGASTSAVFPASDTQKGHTYRAVATPGDGTGFGPSGEAAVTVVNSDPVLAGPTLSPPTATQGTVLTCTATATDPDAADTPTVTYAWSDGSTGATYTVGSADRVGDTLTCTATADDADGGLASAAVSVVVTNAVPLVTDVTVSPSTVRTDDTLTVSATTSDPDGDSLSVTYDWSVDGSVVQSGTDPTLDGTSWFEKGDVVQVAVSADDGLDVTTTVSGSLTVANTAPSAPVVSISPSSPAPGDDLVCAIDTDSTDADADSITYTMAWTVDGVDYDAGGTADTGGLDSGDPGWSGPLTTDWTDDTVDGADVEVDQVWVCTATPHDGDDSGSSATAEATVASSSYSGTIEMPSTGTVDGFSTGPWSTLNGGGRAVSRVELTASCDNPILSLYQHASADTSIQGSYYVTDSAGTELAATSYATYSGCNDCWLPHSTRLSVTLQAGTVYYLGFQNGTGGDMSGPSIYQDANARTVGIATFDDPRADKPSTPTRGLPTTTVSWQNRWRIDCE